MNFRLLSYLGNSRSVLEVPLGSSNLRLLVSLEVNATDEVIETHPFTQ